MLAGRLAGLSLSPFNAGHKVGGSVWRIGLPDGSEVIHAVEWCHRRERCVGMACEGRFRVVMLPVRDRCRAKSGFVTILASFPSCI